MRTVFRLIARAAARGGGRGLWTLRSLAVGAAAFVLAACGQSFESGPAPGGGPGAVIGSGSIKIALLLPLTASGGAASTAKALQNAAELALSEVPAADIQLVPVDTRGTPDGAAAAAQAATAAGARLIIGPLFAAEVSAVTPVARTAGVPVIAFSSDSSVASPGVYLLSFPPEVDVDRVVAYAARQGRRSVGGLLPQSAYGNVVEAALQQSVSNAGGRVLTIAHYEPDAESMRAAVGEIATVAAGAAPQIDALLMPDGPSALPTLATGLAGAAVDNRRVLFLGSGQWNDEAVWKLPGLNGGVFPGPDPAGWQGFVSKYRGRYGVVPPRNATLAYDAVTLAAAIARIGGPDAFTDATLTSPDGFSGVDGIFRFRSNGRIQRGLAILEVQNGAARVIDPAPRSFAAGG